MLSKVVFLFSVMGSLLMAGPFDIDQNFVSTTNAAKWTDPGTGTTFYSGPNIEYKFNPRGASSAPWLQFQLPSAKIGCNGLSIKGGFMALLGLKDIKIQLTNAGPTFAWGVLTTIEISMPSVASVFQRIQKWVRAIQSLMQNSCQAGKMFGNFLKKEYGFGKLESTVLKQGAEAVNGWMNSIEEKINVIDSIGDNDHNETKKAFATNKLHRIGSGVSFLSMNFGKALSECTKEDLNKKEKVDFTAKDLILAGGKVESCDPSAKDADHSKKALSYMMARLLFGEIVVTPKSLAPILEMFNADGHFDKEATKREGKSVIARAEMPIRDIEYSLLPPVITDARKAAHFLIHGSDVKYSVPNTKAVLIKYQSDPTSQGSLVTDANGSTIGSNTVFQTPDATKKLIEIDSVYITRAKDGGNIDDIAWKGLYTESKDAILTYIETALKKKMGATKAANLMGTVAFNQIDLNTTRTPMLVSGMHGYMNTLIQTSLKRGGVFAIMPLIELLSKYNATLFAQQLLSEIKSAIEAAETGPGLITTEHTRKGFADFRKRSQIIYNEMHKHLKSMKKEIISDIQQVPELFERLDTRNRQDRLQMMGK